MRAYPFKIALIAISMALCSCGVMDVQSNHGPNTASANALSPQVHDVSFYARANGGDLRKKVIVLPFLDGDVQHSVQHSQTVKEVARRTVVDDLVGTNEFIVINNND